MILGIKYMLGSTEQKATYKKSMLPYLVGAVLLFGGVSITTKIIENVALDDIGYVNIGSYEPSQASNMANRYIRDHNEKEIQAEYDRAKEELLSESNSEKRNEDKISYLRKYMSVLNSYLTNN